MISLITLTTLPSSGREAVGEDKFHIVTLASELDFHIIREEKNGIKGLSLLPTGFGQFSEHRLPSWLAMGQ